MWKEKLQDTAASHPWLEPHEAIKRKTQAPGMQLVDWYGFTVPKTKKEMFLKQSTHNYSPKKLEESLPKVQKARSVSGCRQGKGNRVSSYQDRSYRFKTKEAYEHGLPGAHESRN